jgi:hypothetical protein
LGEQCARTISSPKINCTGIHPCDLRRTQYAMVAEDQRGRSTAINDGIRECALFIHAFAQDSKVL